MSNTQGQTIENLTLKNISGEVVAWDVVDELFDGKLRKYIDMVKRGEMTSGELAGALKTAINYVYGLTSAKFIGRRSMKL